MARLEMIQSVPEPLVIIVFQADSKTKILIFKYLETVTVLSWKARKVHQ